YLIFSQKPEFQDLSGSFMVKPEYLQRGGAKARAGHHLCHIRGIPSILRSREGKNIHSQKQLFTVTLIVTRIKMAK
ncbi:RHOBTB3 isoform 1, partial [Pan troglodytes]